jgi:hypothetical protein
MRSSTATRLRGRAPRSNTVVQHRDPAPQFSNAIKQCDPAMRSSNAIQQCDPINAINRCNQAMRSIKMTGPCDTSIQQSTINTCLEYPLPQIQRPNWIQHPSFKLVQHYVAVWCTQRGHSIQECGHASMR